MDQPDRRRSAVRLPAVVERRRVDRRARQAAVLDHRRATDRRLDAAGAALLLQRSAFVRQTSGAHAVPALAVATAAASPRPARSGGTGDRSAAGGARVVGLDGPRPAPSVDEPAAARAVVDLADDACTEVVPCPLCSVLFDPLWLFQHVAVDH